MSGSVISLISIPTACATKIRVLLLSFPDCRFQFNYQRELFCDLFSLLCSLSLKACRSNHNRASSSLELPYTNIVRGPNWVTCYKHWPGSRHVYLELIAKNLYLTCIVTVTQSTLSLSDDANTWFHQTCEKNLTLKIDKQYYAAS